jgi:hypothetical protein
MLNAYFSWRNYIDGRPENRSRRDYLHSLFSGLSPGDLIITLNWDTTAERTLAEEGRWSPIDGYGLGRRAARVKSRTGDGPKFFPVRSDVTILKLHGGVGWKRDEYSPDGIYLSEAYLLQELPVTYGGEVWLFEENGYDRHFRPDEFSKEPLEALDVVLEIPSYLKQPPTGRDMKRVWSRADLAIRNADEIEVWGYGLPESDGQIRVLLSTLPRRLRRRSVRVAVHNPDAEACDRWREFLGSDAAVDRARLG